MKDKNLLKITSYLRNFIEKPFNERSKDSKKNLIIIRYILKANKKLIINAISQDVKKSIQDAQIEFKSSLDILNYVIDNFHYVKKQEKFVFKNGDVGIVNFEPVGVVAFITPWNYPLLTIFERLPFSLAWLLLSNRVNLLFHQKEF